MIAIIYGKIELIKNFKIAQSCVDMEDNLFCLTWKTIYFVCDNVFFISLIYSYSVSNKWTTEKTKTKKKQVKLNLHTTT